MKDEFDFFQKALEEGYWTKDGRFCILGARQREGRKKEVLVYKEATMVLMWQNVYEAKTSGRVYINKRGELIDIDEPDLISYQTLKKLQSFPTWKIEKNIEE